MKASLLAILVTTTLGFGLSPQANAASLDQSGPAVQRVNRSHDCMLNSDPMCNTSAVAYDDRGYGMVDRRFHRGYRMHVMRPSYGYDAETVIVPTGDTYSAVPDTYSDSRCTNISGEGTGVPAYLYGECRTRNGGF
jgi:hypothetical protein